MKKLFLSLMTALMVLSPTAACSAAQESADDPIQEFSVAVDAGPNTITFELIKLDQPFFASDKYKVSTAYRDGKMYIASTGDNGIFVYNIEGNTATFSNTIDYTAPDAIAVGNDGTIYLNGGVFGSIPVSADGTVGEKVTAKGELTISPDGSAGVTFFSGRKYATIVSVDGSSVEETMQFTPEEFANIYHVNISDEEIIIGGSSADGSGKAIAVYDLDGNFKYIVNGVPSQNNYMDVYATENGVIGVTPSTIGLGDTEGNAYEIINMKDFAGVSLTPKDIMETEDGSLIISACAANTSGEVILIRVTGF